MMTSPQEIISRLARNREVFSHLLANVTLEQVHWSQEPAKWSLLLTVCHLRDEEREDFRTRLRMVLESPGQPFPGINPAGWVVDRQYGAQDFATVMREFLDERERSIHWLEGLQQPSWDNATIHHSLGPMSGHFILANWLAHDYLHIRQITRLHYDYLHHAYGQPLNYAGYW